MNFDRKRHTSALTGKSEGIFSTSGYGEEDVFNIICSELGIRFQGASPVIKDEAELQQFAKMVSKAWAEHKMHVPVKDTPKIIQ